MFPSHALCVCYRAVVGGAENTCNGRRGKHMAATEIEFIAEWPPGSPPPAKIKRTSSLSPVEKESCGSESQFEADLAAYSADTGIDSLIAKWWKKRKRLNQDFHLPDCASPKTTLYHVSKST